MMWLHGDTLSFTMLFVTPTTFNGSQHQTYHLDGVITVQLCSFVVALCALQKKTDLFNTVTMVPYYYTRGSTLISTCNMLSSNYICCIHPHCSIYNINVIASITCLKHSS